MKTGLAILILPFALGIRRREIGTPPPGIPPLPSCTADADCLESTYCQLPENCEHDPCPGICIESTDEEVPSEELSIELSEPEAEEAIAALDLSCRSDNDCLTKLVAENSRCELPDACAQNTEECVGFCKVIVDAVEPQVMQTATDMIDGAGAPLLPSRFNELVPEDVSMSQCLPALKLKMECLATRITVAESIDDFKGRMAVCILDEGKCEVSMDLEPFRRRQAAARALRHNRRQVTEDPIEGADIYNGTHSGFAQWMRIKECAKSRLPFDVYEKTSECLSSRGYPQLKPELIEKIQFRGMEKICKFLEAPALIEKSCQNHDAIKTCLSDLLNGVDVTNEGSLLDHICQANDQCHIEIPNQDCKNEILMLKQLKVDACDCQLNEFPEENRSLIKETLLQCGTEEGMTEEQISIRLQAFVDSCTDMEDFDGEPRPPICNHGHLW